MLWMFVDVAWWFDCNLNCYYCVWDVDCKNVWEIENPVKVNHTKILSALHAHFPDTLELEKIYQSALLYVCILRPNIFSVASILTKILIMIMCIECEYVSVGCERDQYLYKFICAWSTWQMCKWQWSGLLTSL